jgi:hypothetical protein
MPSWVDLLASVRAGLSGPLKSGDFDSKAFEHALAQNNLPLAFDFIEDATGRGPLEDAVKGALPVGLQPQSLAKAIADLPFAGYITTNYDSLLEKALSSEAGWVPVGNSPQEVPKVSGDARNLVWHLHGAQDMSGDKSSLVLSDRDYQSLYLDSSPAMRQLQGLLAHKRVVFLGFSFADQEVIRLLKAVGRLTDVTRPAFAFVPAIGEFKHDTGRAVFRRQYNVDLIPYPVLGDSHKALLDFLNVYSSLVVRRSITLGSAKQKVPDYDPETTGLLIYNELVGKGELDPSVEHLRESLTDSRILALLVDAPRLFESLVDDVEGFARALGQRVDGVLDSAQARELVSSRCERLEARGLIAISNGSVSLTSGGQDAFRTSVAQSELMRDQFRSSLLARARAHLSGANAKEVADAAATFLDDCIRRRSLGVAMALAVDKSQQHDYHMVGLLQGLKTQLATMTDMGEARALIATVQDALAKPNEAEERYIGTALQAGFGVHLLGFDQDTIAVRLRDLSATVFVLDATTLIPALAKGSRGHQAAAHLLAQLKHRGCVATTTGLLVEEASEHARWAQRKVQEGGSWQSAPVLEALLGSSGERSNDFLQGFVESLDAGDCPADFTAFLSACFGGCDVTGGVKNEHVVRGLEALGVKVLDRVDRAYGHGAADKVTLDTYKATITQRRQGNATWTHPRQVSAEAEALVLVEGLRDGHLRVGTDNATSAYFVSHSQFLNEVTGSVLPSVLRQEAALQWLVALRGHGPESARAVYDGLLWELQERRADLVDKGILRRVFKPTIDAAREDLEGELERYRHQMATAATSPGVEFDPLDGPRVLAGAIAQTTLALSAKLAETEARVYKLERELEEKSRADEAARVARKVKGGERYRRQQERRQRKPRS